VHSRAAGLTKKSNQVGSNIGEDLSQQEGKSWKLEPKGGEE